ncbi:PAS domain-containing methyl-accepting chemotaxis protein [Vibrio amylolyticus]|uniref:methyl-accepting chemotaxis protein n=1 Tax=Vibrio amylolyticus TaxID=2847292 RepID=UPI00354E07FF
MNKRNMKVIDEEVEFSEDVELVSTTDKRGIITYANDEFYKVAGYTPEELLNKNHNIIRHPDMPKAAFKDLWDHLKGGQAWRGAVKNRCKDGRYYWVDAFVTPVFEEGVLVGYQSVRRKLAPEVKDRAIKLYASVNEGKRNRLGAILELVKKQRIPTLSLVTLLAMLAGLFYSPLFTLIIPITTVVLLYQDLFVRQKFYDNLQRNYDSVSRLVFCDDPNNYAEYHLKMDEGRIRTILGRTQDSSHNLQHQVDSLEVTSEQVLDSIEKENLEIESVVTAIEQMVMTINEISRNTSNSIEQVSSANQDCQEANSLIDKTQQHVSVLVDDVEASRSSTESLSNEFANINELMSEIQGIAEQTNLLALNAAIEAARAGELGRGFAVVADEVRNLSQRTQKVTERIHQSMEGVSHSVNELSESMQKGQSSAKTCIDFTAETRTKIDSLTKIMDNIELETTQISTAAEQQSAAAQEINQNVSSVRNASQSNLESVNEVTMLTKNIKNKADQLASLSLSFKR